MHGDLIYLDCEVLIVGSGIAGLGAGIKISEAGVRRLDYDRPPLSKQVLSGKWGVDRAELISQDELSGAAIDSRTGIPRWLPPPP